MLGDSIQKKEKMCVCSFFFVILHHEFDIIMKLGHFSTIAFLLLLLFTAETVWAERVSETEAFQKAKAFMSGRGMRQQRQQQAPRSLRMAVKGYRTGVQQRPDADYYVFNAADEGGFVIVSGDDRAVPILGYADQGSFRADSMPEGLRCLLESYAEQVANLDDEPVGRLREMETTPTRTSISPLIPSRWNQNAPYCNLTPQISEKSTYTGCVATTLAQVMYYYQYPTGPTTSIPAYSYTAFDADDKSFKMSLDELPATTFDWTSMTPTYNSNSSDESKEAVAKLMQYCGWAVQMQYGLHASSAYAEQIPYALKNYFGYDAGVRLAYRTWYSYPEWVSLIYAELAASRPVMLGGQSLGGGHSFICDGYNTDDYFHFNWGWGGNSDGYYRLSALNPYEQGVGGSSTLDGFSTSINLIFGIQPPASDSKSYCLSLEQLTLSSPDESRVSKEYERDASSDPFEGIGINGLLYSYYSTRTYFDWAFQLVDEHGAVVHTLFEDTGDSFFDFNSYAPITANDLSIPATVPNGKYVMKMVSRVHGTTDWQECHGGDRFQFTAVISDNRLTITVPHPDEIPPVAASLTVNGNLTAGYEQEVIASITGGAIDYHGPVFLRVNGSSVMGKTLDIPAGQTVDARFVYTPSAAGDQVLSLSNQNSGGSAIGTSTTVTILASDATNTQDVALESTVTNLISDGILRGNGLQLTVKVTNPSTENRFVSKLHCSLRGYNSKDDDVNNHAYYYYLSKSVVVEKGGTSDVDFTFDGLDPSKFYRFRISYDKGDGSKALPISNLYEVGEGLVLYAADGTPTYSALPAEGPIAMGDACFVDLRFLPDLSQVAPSSNPNCVYLLTDEAAVPVALEGKNIVRDGKAATLAITDGSDFFTPVSIHADEVSYARQFTLAAGGTSGWNTIILPFEVTSVTCSNIGTVDWFHSATDTGKNFWLRAFTADEKASVIFDYADRFLANTPYIIAVPDDRWGKDWQMAGDGRVVTFHGANATIAPTAETSVGGNHYKLLGSSTTMTRSKIYQLNAEGSNFEYCAAETTVAPFRAVFTPVSISSLACPSLAIRQPETTGINNMNIHTTADRAGLPFAVPACYDLYGRKVASTPQKGIYIRNGRKVVIK